MEQLLTTHPAWYGVTVHPTWCMVEIIMMEQAWNFFIQVNS